MELLLLLQVMWMKLSIIIPTYNEEEYLPKLLEGIKSQDFEDYEIIVADANSTDKTREIAEVYGCKIVDGGCRLRVGIMALKWPEESSYYSLMLMLF